MQDYPTIFCNVLIEESKRRLLNEGVPRLKQCLNELTEEQIWHKPNKNSNSVGNLALHLCGNVRQWIITGLGNATDTRERQKEFDEKGPIATKILVNQLDLLMEEVVQVLDNVSPDDLLMKKDVQGFEETGLAILVHVVEHFSYHVGQVTYVVKMVKDMDVGYYAGQDL